LTTDLILYEIDIARTALAKAVTIQQTKNVLDVAVAAETYAKRQKMGEEAVSYARTLIVEALCQLGRMLKETPRNRGAAGIGPIAVPDEYHNQEPTLAELGLDKKTSKLAQDIYALPEEEIEKVKAGVMSLHDAEKKVKEKKRTEERQFMADTIIAIEPDSRWRIFHDKMEEWQADKQYDFIITDPPYPKEFLPYYGLLAMRAKEWLKPGGLLIAMAGQSYLDEIYKMMSAYLEYYWTAAYLTPGQPTPLRQRNVNTTWKPLLIYSNGTYTGKIFGDVFKSDGNDKDFHKWGQSISGMYSIISGICLAGQSILDPFCGAGTTGIAALQHGCLFDGVEIDEANCNIAKSRLHDTATTR